MADFSSSTTQLDFFGCRSRNTFLLVVTLCFSFVATPQATSSRSADKAALSIQPADLKADIYFLASDDLGGRDSTSLQDHIATDYIAAEFMRLGLKPVGDGGTYFQKMKIITGDLDHEHTTLTATTGGVDRSYTLSQDFWWAHQRLRPQKVCGTVAFAGYGINAPEYAYNDFAGLDLKGKVAIVFSREPQANDVRSQFMGKFDTYHAFDREKVEELRKLGVAGLLIIQDQHADRTKPIPASSERFSGGPLYALAGEMWDIPVFIIRREVADQLLAPSRKTSAELQTQIDRTMHPDSFAVPNSTVCMSKAFTNLQTHEGRNVAGLLEGTDPRLRAQTIIVSAHHDHMGISHGQIYHGADDDASGVAGVMEIAKAMAENKDHPKRSVLFLAFDGEERVYLGSYYYVTHPIVPLNQTVANLNMDMIGRNENDSNWPLPPDANVNMVNVLGTRYNPALRQVIDRQNAREGLNLDYKMDREDPDSLWSRSDQFWFAALHIPQVEFQTGLHPDYHTENDTWQRINYPKLTKIVRLVYLSVAELASSDQNIQFLPQGSPVDTR